MLIEKIEVVRMIEGVLESSVFEKCTDVKAVTAVRNLLYNVQHLDGVPDSVEGSLVLSPREVRVVECFARSWALGDSSELCGGLSFQDAFDLMGRLGVDCSGVSGLVKDLQDKADAKKSFIDEPASPTILDDGSVGFGPERFSKQEMADIQRLFKKDESKEPDNLVQHFEDLNPGAVLKGFSQPAGSKVTIFDADKPGELGVLAHANLAERIALRDMLLGMGFDYDYIDVTTPDEPKSSNFLDRFGPFEG